MSEFRVNQPSSESIFEEQRDPLWFWKRVLIVFRVMAVFYALVSLHLYVASFSAPTSERNQEEVEIVKKDYPLSSNVIFSLITTIEDKKWSNQAMIHLWASEYGVEEAQKKSSKILQTNLSASNVFVAYHLAGFTGDEALLNATKDFLSENAEKTVLDPTWMEEVFAKISEADKYSKEKFNN